MLNLNLLGHWYLDWDCKLQTMDTGWGLKSHNYHAPCVYIPKPFHCTSKPTCVPVGKLSFFCVRTLCSCTQSDSTNAEGQMLPLISFFISSLSRQPCLRPNENVQLQVFDLTLPFENICYIIFFVDFFLSPPCSPMGWRFLLCREKAMD